MNGLGPGAQWSGLVTGFYTAHYILGMFVTIFPNEAPFAVEIAWAPPVAEGDVLVASAT
jgi:hypothetical protein